MNGSRLLKLLLALGVVLALAGFAHSQSLGVPKLEVGLGKTNKPEEVSTSLQILLLLTVLSVAPAIMMLTTAFTRIVIILGLLRTAMGTQTIPPNQVVVGLSLFLTFYVMGPTYQQVYDTAYVPYAVEKKIGFDEAAKRAQKPIRAFMLRNTYQKDLKLFLEMRGEQATSEDVSMMALIPAFIVSELKTAFVVGFYLFVPFVIIDLIVASVLMSLGMMMMPPVVVSLPAKILVFVLADGWTILVQAIVSGYA